MAIQALRDLLEFDPENPTARRELAEVESLKRLAERDSVPSA